MRYRQLGRTGLMVSEIGCGTATLGLANYIEAWDVHSAETERTALAAFERAIELGYNYVDTASSYGAGRSEEIVGKFLRRHRSEVYVATKSRWKDKTKDDVVAEVEGSLHRLQTDVIDVIQFHGGDYREEDFRHIMEGGPFAAYEQLRRDGKVRFLGITAEEPVTLRPFIATGQFDVVQIRFNLIYQNAWHNILPEAKAADLGVVIMRPATSGLFQKLMRHAFPEIDRHVDLYELALSFVLSDPNVSTAIVGVRRPEEAEQNARLSDDLSKRLDLDFFHDRFVSPTDS